MLSRGPVIWLTNSSRPRLLIYLWLGNSPPSTPRSCPNKDGAVADMHLPGANGGKSPSTDAAESWSEWVRVLKAERRRERLWNQCGKWTLSRAKGFPSNFCRLKAGSSNPFSAILSIPLRIRSFTSKTLSQDVFQKPSPPASGLVSLCVTGGCYPTGQAGDET